jgi:peroxiredoxin
MMAALTTPLCDFNRPAYDFSLKDPQGKTWTLTQCTGPQGLLVMFMCNHCPFVQAILPDLVQTTARLKSLGVHTVGVMSNDWEAYPDDAPHHMAQLAVEMDFSFPYVIDETQSGARAYGAVCTPDFFGYNSDLLLQYRGRYDGRARNAVRSGEVSDLESAMREIAATGQGPRNQQASIGCSIKWREKEG